MKAKFKYSLDNFRGIAIIFVMLSHISSIRNMGEFGNILYYIIGDATSWFVFISGYLFYYLEINKFNYFEYLFKKVKFVILPYFILLIPTIFIWIYLSQHVLYGLTPAAFFTWSLISGGIEVGPMWFIPMIIIFFIMTPIFKILSRSKFIYLALFIGLFFSIFSARPVFNANALLSFFHFAGFYIFGIVMAKNSGTIEKMRNEFKILLIISGFAVFIFFGVTFPGIASFPSSFSDGLGELNYILAGKLGLLIVIFFLFDKFFEKKNIILGYFAKISFGLFFIHGFVTVIFQQVSKKIYFHDPFLNLLCEVIVVVFGSVLIVFLMKKMFGKWSRYVIGC